MQVTVTFDMSEDKYEYACFNQSNNMAQFIWEFENKLKSWSQHGHPFKDMDEMIQEILAEWYDMKEYNNVREIEE